MEPPSTELYVAPSGPTPAPRPNVDVIEHGGRRVYLVGTAHVSHQSAELVEQVIREYHPDAICLELCDARFDALRDPNRWRETDLVKLIRDGKAYVLMAQLALAGFQKRVADELKIRPGEEMRRAMSVADELQIPLIRADRDVKVTLRRAWAKTSLWSASRVLYSLLCAIFDKSNAIKTEDIEALKESADLEGLLDQFSKKLPGVKEILIDERDRYLATKILMAPGENKVAVVGAAHVPGIKRFFGNQANLAELEEIPKARLWWRVMGWSIPILLVALLGYGFFLGAQQSFDMLKIWFLVVGGATALGALLALAHPITIIAAFLTGPIAALHPVLRAGWICGLVEAFVRKPKVKDFETLASDVLSIRGVFRNRVSHVLVIMVFTKFFEIFGIALSVGKIAAYLR